MSLFSGKKLFLFGFIVVLLVAIPLTVYLAQQQQKTKSSAAKSTILSLVESEKTNSSIAATVDETFKIDVMVDPRENLVNYAKFTLSYDATKIATVDAGIVINSDALPNVLLGPAYEPSQVSITLSSANDLTKVIQVPTKIATITFKAKAITGADTPTLVRFGNDTEVMSINPVDTTHENVLFTANGAQITITGTTTTTVPGETTTTTSAGTTTTTVPGETTTTVPGETTTTVPGETTTTTAPCAVPTQVTNVAITFPNCENGNCSYTQGRCSWNTLTGATGYNVKVTAVTTNTAVLDQQSNTSTSSAFPVATSDTYRCDVSAVNACGIGVVGTSTLLCTTDVVVTTTTTTTTTTILPPTPTATIAVAPTIAPTGPGDAIMTIGALGAIFTIIGAILLFAL